MDNRKKALRKEFLSLRNQITPEKVTVGMLKKYPEYISAQTVFCYISAHGEVDTYSLIEELLKTKTVVVPYCLDTDGNMIASSIKSLGDLKEGKFGIPEPVSPMEFPKSEIDFVIVPGVSFDQNGYRLGYGKGYYDRFLKAISPYKLGVCQKEFFVEDLPHDIHDIKMDSVLIVENSL